MESSVIILNTLDTLDTLQPDNVIGITMQTKISSTDRNKMTIDPGYSVLKVSQNFKTKRYLTCENNGKLFRINYDSLLICGICQSNTGDEKTNFMAVCENNHYFHEECVCKWIVESQKPTRVQTTLDDETVVEEFVDFSKDPICPTCNKKLNDTTIWECATKSYFGGRRKYLINKKINQKRRGVSQKKNKYRVKGTNRRKRMAKGTNRSRSSRH
jgi:hypothetical protein